MSPLRSFLLHLRLPFQLLLAPIFLWGALASERPPGARFLLGFALFHLCLYAGATAYNSYYDRDEGPIGGLKRPPEVHASLLWASLALEFLGLALAPMVSIPFALIYLALFLLGIGYSHPGLRWKRSPWTSLLLVSIGQGAGAFLGGLLAAGGKAHLLANGAGASAAAVALLIPTGLYPLTQVYQIEEDARRGDRTFAVRYGPRIAFRFAALLLALGAIAAATSLLLRHAPVDGAIVLAGLGVTLFGLMLWARRFAELDVYQNHDRMFRLAGFTSSAFGLYCVARLFFPLTLVLLLGMAGLGATRAEATERTPQGDPLSVTVSELPGEVLEINAWIRIGQTRPDSAFAVVSDFEHLAAFMPNIERCRVVARTESTVTVDQEGTARFVVRKHLRTVVEYKLGPHRLDFHQIEGEMKRFDGFWSVTPARGDSSLVLFRSQLRVESAVPGFIIRRVIKQQFSRMMPAVAEEVRRRALARKASRP